VASRHARFGAVALSASAGISVAYVFIHILPELAEAQAFYLQVRPDRPLLWFKEQIFLVALLGLLAMYGLDKIALTRADVESSRFWLHASSFALYNALLGFFVATRTEARGLVLTTVAFAAHLLVTDRGLMREYGTRYDQEGRIVFSAALFAGWAGGVWAPVPQLVVAMLFAFLAGGILLNALKEELPSQREGRLAPFFVGTMSYTLLQLASFAVVRSAGGE